MTEEIPYLATQPPVAFPDNLRTFTSISNFLDPRFDTLECSAVPDSKKLTGLSKQKVTFHENV